MRQYTPFLQKILKLSPSNMPFETTTGAYKAWFRPWITLSAMSFFAILIGSSLYHFNKPSNPCLALVNFEHVFVTVSPQMAPTYPDGTKLSFPLDVTPAEIAGFLTRELHFDAVVADRISKTARVDIDDNELDFSGKAICSSGYAIPATALQKEEPYVTLIRRNNFADTLSLSRTLFTIWLIACAAMAGAIALILWMLGRFQKQKMGKSGAVLPSQLTRSSSPAAEGQNTGTELMMPNLEEKESKVRFFMEVLLHSFAASLAVPIVKVAGFGGAIPVIAIGLVFGAISMATVRFVRSKIPNDRVRRTVLLVLPFAYFFLYVALYVGIRSA
ncbi:MAG: hypothetical protein K8R10_06250 [Rhodocyclales bacterium]|jgi:hypothetical protein|nr:hypothetical protein [Rhodocyclales bacterium]